MMTRRFVLSTVGISTLLRGSDRELRGRLIGAANDRQLDPDLDDEVASLAEQVAETLRRNHIDTNRHLSAELKGLYGLCNDQLTRGSRDMHYLVATDTALGQVASRLIEDYLKSQGLIVNVYTPSELSTANPASFSRGMTRLIEWCEKTIPGYQDDGYQVTFNLTGGFKSLQGYLNIVGMFYADELVYIFEGSDDLLTIPRLPIKVADEALREYSVPMAMMAQGHLMRLDQVQQIPGGLLDIQDGLATLSDWGFLIWSRARHELLGEELLTFPRLRYSAGFVKTFDQARPYQRVPLQETLAKVAGLLEESGGDLRQLRKDGGLQYENYVNMTTQDGQRIGHFRLTDGRRVSCTLEEDGCLLLRTFGAHDTVNDNP